jgi:NAD(P)-dependent dehydrogenase (short-subunit alcohol dehydrogenase family)
MKKRIFITGSADGLGAMAANILVREGHSLVLHARSAQRAADAMRTVPGAESILVADVSTLDQAAHLATLANACGPFDAVIHNVAVGFREPLQRTTKGVPHVLAINSLSPYVLTALMKPPKRLIYLSSRLHQDGDGTLEDLLWERKAWSPLQAYCDTKLHNVMLAFAMARLWPGVISNALEPGWVATKMGGPEAPDDIDAAPVTQAWLASSEEAAVKVSGRYFYHQRQMPAAAAAVNTGLQDLMLERFASITGVRLTNLTPAE